MKRRDHPAQIGAAEIRELCRVARQRGIAVTRGVAMGNGRHGPIYRLEGNGCVAVAWFDAGGAPQIKTGGPS